MPYNSMPADQLWSEIDQQRRRTVELLADLDDAEWDRPSLCAEWTVRQVVAHLTLQQVGLAGMITMMARSPAALRRRDGNTMIKEAADRQSAALTTDAMIAAIAAMIGSRRHNIGVTPYETLIDICLHSQDIAIPLGRELPLSTAASVAVADRVWRIGWPWHAARACAGLRFVATDADWAVGDGLEISGPVQAIVLVLTERSAGMSGLTGPGTAELAGRRSPRAT